MKLGRIIKWIIFIGYISSELIQIWRASYVKLESVSNLYIIDGFLLGVAFQNIILIAGAYYLMFKCEYKWIKSLYFNCFRKSHSKEGSGIGDEGKVLLKS